MQTNINYFTLIMKYTVNTAWNHTQMFAVDKDLTFYYILVTVDLTDLMFAVLYLPHPTWMSCQCSRWTESYFPCRCTLQHHPVWGQKLSVSMGLKSPISSKIQFLSSPSTKLRRVLAFKQKSMVYCETVK